MDCGKITKNLYSQHYFDFEWKHKSYLEKINDVSLDTLLAQGSWHSAVIALRQTSLIALIILTWLTMMHWCVELTKAINPRHITYFDPFSKANLSFFALTIALILILSFCWSALDRLSYRHDADKTYPYILTLIIITGISAESLRSIWLFWMASWIQDSYVLASMFLVGQFIALILLGIFIAQSFNPIKSWLLGKDLDFTKIA